MSAPVAELAVRVARKQPVALDICSLDLVATDGGALPAFEAGAHVDVHLPGGVVRSYSLAGDPEDRSHWVLGVLRDSSTGLSDLSHRLRGG